MIDTNATRIEKIRAELLDQYSIKKCDIKIIDGTISCDSANSIAKTGNISFKYPTTTRLVEDNPPNTDIIITSANGSKYYLGIDTDGVLCTYPVPQQDLTATKNLANIYVADDGKLEGNGAITVDTEECTLMDLNGFTWIVGVAAGGNIYTQESGADRKVYYRNEQVKINYLTDRLKVWYMINGVWYSLGEFAMTKPKNVRGIVSTPLMDLTVLIQKRRILDAVVFSKGTPYHEVLSYFIISSGYTKVNIESTDLVLQSDRIFDDSKNKLEWFNLVAKEINYTNLQVDADGYFTSRRYVQPNLSNVKHVYKINKDSIVSGDFDVEEDFWNTYNIIKCVHSNPNTPLMISIARNDDPSDAFSTYNIGEVPLTIKIDNVADKQELDTIATKMLFEQRQITQNVTFSTLINPTHGVGDVLQIQGPTFEGIVLEGKWTIPLKAGSLMDHICKRVVDIRTVVE